MTQFRSIAVVGRDAPLWLTCLSLHRALAPAGVVVIAVELPSALSHHHVYTASPALNGLHALVGLDRRAVLKAAGGIAAGGQRHVGWSDTPYFTAFDGPRPAFDGLDVLQHWVAARRDGARVPLERLSLGASALARGRVGADRCDPTAFGTIHRGSHLDGLAYTALLRAAVAKCNIARRDAAHAKPVFEGINLVRIDAAAGDQIQADLFVDVSGPHAWLASRQLGDDWKDWNDLLPTRALWWASAPALRPLPPFTELKRNSLGWSARVPLSGRTAIVVGSRSSAEPDLVEAAGTDRVSPAIGECFAAGCRSAWRANVIALGEAACKVEPFDFMALHMLHAGIANLIAWFPATQAECPALRQHVNATLRRQAESARDFQAARSLLANAACEGRHETLPSSLKHRVALFEARARVQLLDDDLFDEALWSLQFAGLGIIPKSADPRTRRTSRESRERQLARLIAAIESEVAAMPTVVADLAG